MNEKNSVALDESWRDPINLQAKLLKHQSFEAEILANRNRVQNLMKVRHWNRMSEYLFNLNLFV